MRRFKSAGFTLIEVMIVVAIIGILATIAYPSYRDYIIRGRLVDGTNGLASMQAEMERYFQDNRRYVAVSATIVPPCDPSTPVLTRTFGNFVVTCVTAAGPPATYTMQAVGRANGPMAGFGFQVTQAPNSQTTTTTVAGWIPTNNTCWLVRKGQC